SVSSSSVTWPKARRATGPSSCPVAPAGETARHVGRRRSLPWAAAPCGHLAHCAAWCRIGMYSKVYSRSAGKSTRWTLCAWISDLKVRIFALDQVPVPGVDRLRDRDQGQRRLDVAARLDPPAG